ncbi:MAG TPA: GrdX protein [Clostridiaceae bacterium]|nr:GrdX protein [Clostridiaceae bacterium]
MVNFWRLTLGGEQETLHANKYQIVTNNPMVADVFGERCRVVFLEQGSDRDVIETVRDLVHQHYRVLTAPLAGSVKPWETPYRSVMVSTSKGSAIDETSLELVEFALMVIRQSKERLETTKPSIDSDFQTIDLSLIESALPSVEAIGRI